MVSAYKTKRIVQETVIVNYHVSMPENILRDIINKGLQDIVLEKKLMNSYKFLLKIMILASAKKTALFF